MKHVIAVLAAGALLGSILSAAPPESKNKAEFEKLKSLEGVWEGESSDGNPAHVSYKVVSAGSTVMETIDHTHMAEMMVTMYHLDGDNLMMTHYCSAGNQPRMRLVSSTPNSLTFKMFDATNLASDNDGHMSGVTITWTDKDHITSDWVYSKDGKEQHHGIFKLGRKITTKVD